MDKKLFAITLLSTFAFLSTSANAAPVHTWNQVFSSKGNWTVKLSMLNEGGHFYDTAGAEISKFDLTHGTGYKYGFGFDHGADFDIAYTMVAIQQTPPAFVSKTCVFVVTASAPARPDIRVSTFNGAQCSFKIVPGVGENFFVS